jgi:putative transposase
LSPGQKRQAVRELRQAGLTLRAALALVQLPRATFYRRRRGRLDTEELKERIRELALNHASFGYRRITAVLRRKGWRVNPKRVYRLYRQMDLQRPTRRKGRRGVKRPVAFRPTEAQAPGQVWAIDFIEDKLVSGRLFLSHGAPRVLRRDQGPEFESRVFQKLLRTWRIQDEPVPKGQPFDNGHMESFHGSLRDELLDAELFHSLGEAQTKVARWLHWYNNERPHQSLGYRTPRERWEAAAPQGASVSYGPPPPEGRLGMPSHDSYLNPLI